MTINMASLGIGVLIGVILTIMVISLAFNAKAYIFNKKTATPDRVDAVSYSALQVATNAIMEEVETRRAEDEKKFLQLKADTEACLEHLAAADYATKPEAQYIAADIFKDAFEKGIFDAVIEKTAESATKKMLYDIFGSESIVGEPKTQEKTIASDVDEELIRDLEEQYL